MRTSLLLLAILLFSSAAFAGDVRDFDNKTISLAVDAPTSTLTATPPTNPSGIGAANPNQVPLEHVTLLTVTVTPGMNPTSTGLTVTGDLSLIGGSATQTFHDDGSNGDVTPNDNTFSFQATMGNAASAGLKFLPIFVADAQMRLGRTTISIWVITPFPVPTPTPTPTPPIQCEVCHKGTTLTLLCNSMEYRRHLDHGDVSGTCSPPRPIDADGRR